MFVVDLLLALKPLRHRSAPLGKANETLARIHEVVVLYHRLPKLSVGGKEFISNDIFKSL